MHKTGFRIFDVRANRIKGAAVFNYKGFEISMSTVFNPPEVGIFHPSNSNFFASASTVEEAIKWLDAYVAPQDSHSGEDGVWMYQSKDGRWNTFINDAHFHNTKNDPTQEFPVKFFQKI